MYSFSYLEPVCCSMSSSNCCFLTCIQVSQETAQVVWYSHLFQNFPQFIMIHTVKGFGIVNTAEIDVFLEFSLVIASWFLWKDLMSSTLCSHKMGFPSDSDSKESVCNAEYLHLIPGLGRAPGERNGNSLQVSFPGESHGQRSLAGYSPWGHTVGLHD